MFSTSAVIIQCHPLSLTTQLRARVVLPVAVAICRRHSCSAYTTLRFLNNVIILELRPPIGSNVDMYLSLCQTPLHSRCVYREVNTSRWSPLLWNARTMTDKITSLFSYITRFHPSAAPWCPTSISIVM